MSSRVAITVPGVTSAPGLTWRMPSTPAKGARITRSDRLARICATCALAASRLARALSSAERATSCCPDSWLMRWNCCWASACCACAEASKARCWSPLRVTSGAPRTTSWPLSKCTASTVSLTLAVTVTASCARTVPSACSVSVQSSSRTTWAPTATGALPRPPGPPPASLPQATRPRLPSSSTANARCAGRKAMAQPVRQAADSTCPA